MGTMAQDDLEKVLGKVIDQKVTPLFVKVEKRLEKIETKQKEHDEKFDSIDKQLIRIDEKLDATMEMTAKNSEDITMVKIDITEMQEDVADTNFTAQRIESKLNTVMKDRDHQDSKARQLNRRVLKLESKRS